MFVVFEGVDGSGKSTLIDKISKIKPIEGLDPVVLRLFDFFDEGTKIKIKESLQEPYFDPPEYVYANKAFSGDKDSLFHGVFEALFELDEKVRALLQQGKLVLLDRWYFSFLIYQGLDGKTESMSAPETSAVNRLMQVESRVIDFHTVFFEVSAKSSTSDGFFKISRKHPVYPDLIFICSRHHEYDYDGFKARHLRWLNKRYKELLVYHSRFIDYHNPVDENISKISEILKAQNEIKEFYRLNSAKNI